MRWTRKSFIARCIMAGLGIPAAAPCAGRSGNESNSGTKETQVARSLPHNTGDFEPAYLSLHRSGELKRRGGEMYEIMRSCHLCPRECRVDRIGGGEGFCHASARLEVSSCGPHFGEEPPLVGHGGSGTIFLTNCGLRCVFCINADISHRGIGAPHTIESLADMMLHVQRIGCHNVNVVTPTHYAPHILLALDIAAGKGLTLPLVYNTCGWEREEILRDYLDGVVDIYLPDCKYSDGRMAAIYSAGAESYPETTYAALLEMHRQVGVAIPDDRGIMRRGLMIRHLVMPNGVSGTRGVIDWIADNLPKDTYLNIMSQYRPMYRASEYSAIDRRLTREEYNDAVNHARSRGLTNLEIQGFRAWGL